MWDRLLAGDIPRERQVDFVARILASAMKARLEHVSFTFAIVACLRT
jgi:thymidylate synthase (FAD)